MKEYFRPLFIFVGGNIGLLFLMLFMPALGTVQTGLETDLAAEIPTFWGLSWVITSLRVLVFVFVEGLILYAVAKAFLGLRQ